MKFPALAPALALAVAAVSPALLVAQPANEPFLKWLDSTAQKQLADRDATIRAIRTPEQVAARKQYVRAKLLELIGGLPNYQGPLNARKYWQKDMGRYVIEGITYESLPGYIVTANLYRPRAIGRYPAVLFPLGHWDIGKAAAQRIAANLAIKGFVVLAFDPMGQGERQQSYDSRMARSLIGGSTEQHFMNGALATLAGGNVARYFIWDGMRGIDYLQSREEVDPSRIGCTGCSGGGTQTTYISALDERVKVAAPACYMQSFKLLYSGSIGDSEQSFANFISSGLDQTDYVELFSPKPWLITNTEKDFFTPAAAKIVYEEARNWYEMAGAQEKVKWVVGPGGHGTPLNVREAIYDWMIRWIGDGRTSSKEEEVDMLPDLELNVTPGGQVGGVDLYTHIAKELKSPSTIPALPNDPYPVNEKLLEGAGSTAVVVVETGTLPGYRAEQLHKRGVTVLAINPRGYPVTRYPFYSGDWATNERAWLIGKNLPLMRAADIATAARKLKARPGIERVLVTASGVGGWWAIYALQNEPAIAKAWVDKTPHSIRAAFDQPVHQDLHDVVIPGVVPDVKPSRRLLWTDPTDWMRNVIKVPGEYVYRQVIYDDDSERLITLFLK